MERIAAIEEQTRTRDAALAQVSARDAEVMARMSDFGERLDAISAAEGDGEEDEESEPSQAKRKKRGGRKCGCGAEAWNEAGIRLGAHVGFVFAFTDTPFDGPSLRTHATGRRLPFGGSRVARGTAVGGGGEDVQLAAWRDLADGALPPPLRLGVAGAIPTRHGVGSFATACSGYLSSAAPSRRDILSFTAAALGHEGRARCQSLSAASWRLVVAVRTLRTPSHAGAAGAALPACGLREACTGPQARPSRTAGARRTRQEQDCQRVTR
jgi:hypothetical protein